jgi:hypothetical protein
MIIFTCCCREKTHYPIRGVTDFGMGGDALWFGFGRGRHPPGRRLDEGGNDQDGSIHVLL